MCSITKEQIYTDIVINNMAQQPMSSSCLQLLRSKFTQTWLIITWHNSQSTANVFNYYGANSHRHGY